MNCQCGSLLSEREVEENDGFCDQCDALYEEQLREREVEETSEEVVAQFTFSLPNGTVYTGKVTRADGVIYTVTLARNGETLCGHTFSTNDAVYALLEGNRQYMKMLDEKINPFGNHDGNH